MAEGRQWTRAVPLLRRLRHPGSPWTRADVLTAAALVVAIIAVLVPAVLSRRGNEVASSALDEARRANEIAASAQTLRPQLTVSAVAASITDGLSGTKTDGPTTSRLTDARGSKIDITLGNSSSGAALVTSAVLDVSFARHLESCSGIGGELTISVDYDVPVTTTATPVTLTRDMRFQVDGGKHERFTLTVGPKGLEEDTPLVLVVAVTLVHDGGARLPAGTFALLDTGQDSYFYPKPDGTWEISDPGTVTAEQRACFLRNAAWVSEIAKRPGVTVSRELRSLDEALRAY